MGLLIVGGYGLVFQVSSVPDKLTDQGLLLAAFILVLGAGAILAILKWGPDAYLKIKSGGNGHGAKVDQILAGQAAMGAKLEVLIVQVERFSRSYHDRLIPDIHGFSIAALRRAGLGELADLEEKRIANLKGKDG